MLSLLDIHKQYNWLTKSNFYNLLTDSNHFNDNNIDDNNNNNNNIKNDINPAYLICSEDETNLQIILNVIKYWDVTYLPPSIIYTIRYSDIDLAQFNYSKEEESFYSFYKILQSTSPDDMFLLCAKENRVDLFIYSHLNNYIWNNKAIPIAITKNSLQFLHLAKKYNYLNNHFQIVYNLLCKANNDEQMDHYLKCQLMDIVLLYGNQTCFKYLIKHKHPISYDILIEIAIRYGFVDILDDIISNSDYISYEYALQISSECGQLNCLQYIHEKSNNHYINDKKYCYLAARYGHLACLQYLHANGYIITSNILYLSIPYTNNIDCLIYLHKHLEQPITTELCMRAIKHNRLDFFEYAHRNGCPWDNINRNIYVDRASSYRMYDIVDYIENNGGKCDILRTPCGTAGYC